MNTELIDVSATNKEIRIEIPPEQVREVYDTVSKKYADQAQVPGFRKGFAPIDVIRMRFQEEIKSEVIQEILPPKVTEAIQKHQLSPLAEPQLHLDDPENVKVNGSQPLVIKAHVQVMPEIPKPKYEGLEATRRIKPVSDEQIENISDETRKQQSTLIPVEDRKSKDGDMVIADLKGTFLDDENADPIEVNDLEVPLGDEVVEKSFSDNLQGVEEGDEREFEVEYPAEFSSPALAGRKVSYKALVKSVGNVELPELDDAWIESLDEEYKTVKELKIGLRKDLETMAKADADSRVRNDLIAKLIESQDFEVPDALIENQAQTLLNNFAQDLAQRGVDLSKVEKDFVEMTYNQMKGQAERDVRGAMLLERIADLEKLEIGKEEVEKEIGMMAAQYQTTPDEIRRSLDEQGGDAMIENNLRTRAAVEALADKAKISDGEWIDEANQEPEVVSPESDEEKPKKADKKKAKKKDKKEKKDKKSSKKKSKGK